MRRIRHVLTVMLFALPWGSVVRADALQIGQPFPAVLCQRVAVDRPTQLKTVPEILKRRAIVFVFASW